MFTFDHNGGYVVSAFGITCVVLGTYALYLRSRLSGLRRRLELAQQGDDRPDVGDGEVQAERVLVAATRRSES